MIELYFVSFYLMHGVFSDHTETLVMVNFWANVISVTFMQSVGVHIGGFSMNEDLASKWFDGCLIVVKLVIEVLPH